MVQSEFEAEVSSSHWLHLEYHYPVFHWLLCFYLGLVSLFFGLIGLLGLVSVFGWFFSTTPDSGSLWGGLGFSLMGLGLPIGILWDSRKLFRDLISEHHYFVGRVTDLKCERGRTRRYTLHSGNLQWDIEPSAFDRLRIGDRIALEYRPHSRKILRLFSADKSEPESSHSSPSPNAAPTSRSTILQPNQHDHRVGGESLFALMTLKLPKYVWPPFAFLLLYASTLALSGIAPTLAMVLGSFVAVGGGIAWTIAMEGGLASLLGTLVIAVGAIILGDKHFTYPLWGKEAVLNSIADVDQHPEATIFKIKASRIATSVSGIGVIMGRRSALGAVYLFPILPNGLLNSGQTFGSTSDPHGPQPVGQEKRSVPAWAGTTKTGRTQLARIADLPGTDFYAMRYRANWYPDEVEKAKQDLIRGGYAGALGAPTLAVVDDPNQELSRMLQNISLIGASAALLLLVLGPLEEKFRVRIPARRK